MALDTTARPRSSARASPCSPIAACSSSSSRTPRTCSSPTPALRDKVGQALLAIQANRAKEARTLELSARGKGRRTVRVAYIVEAPVWKASYRLTLRGRPRRAALGAAGLGHRRESQRPGLEGCRADAGLGPPGRLPSGAVRGLLRDAAGSAGRGRGPPHARRRSRRRGHGRAARGARHRRRPLRRRSPCSSSATCGRCRAAATAAGAAAPSRSRRRTPRPRSSSVPARR